MSRPVTNADIFSALYEPRRRHILSLLRDGKQWAVKDIVAQTGERQPAVSKHLAMLRRAGVVSLQKRGRHRLYRLEAERLREVLEWVRGFEPFREPQTDRAQAKPATPSRAEAEDVPGA